MIDKLYYPTINTIDDVLPHINGRPEFGINERDDYTVICYNVQMPNTFDIMMDDLHGSLIRRECRGILFNNNGRIISRPFEKFFNLNEKQETSQSLVDLSVKHHIAEKVDGSLIRIFSTEPGGVLRFGTKRGETDIAADAERYARTVLGSEFMEWARTVVDCGFTPLFEWVAPQNRIVIDYDDEQLVLLAIRENITGEYVAELDKFGTYMVPVAECIEYSDDINGLIEAVSSFTDREGIVLYFPELNRRIKMKSDWYVNAHRAKELINQDRHLMLLALDNKLDDVLPLLMDTHREIAVKKVEKVNQLINARTLDISVLLEQIRTWYMRDGVFDKKSIAIEFMPSVSSITRSTLFGLLDRNGFVYDTVVQLVRKYAVKSESEYQRFVNEWLSVSQTV